MGQTGATLYVCHFKSIDSWVGTNNLVFYSGYNVSTLFYSGYNVSTLFYSGYNVSITHSVVDFFFSYVTF
jgi:hypothetical protein